MVRFSVYVVSPSVLRLNNLKVLKIHILGDQGAATRDDAIFSCERYFQAKVYFKSERGKIKAVLEKHCIQEKIILRLTFKFLVSVTG